MVTIEQSPCRDKARLGEWENVTFLALLLSCLPLWRLGVMRLWRHTFAGNQKARASANRQAYHVSYLLVMYHMVQGSRKQAGLVLHHERLFY